MRRLFIVPLAVAAAVASLVLAPTTSAIAGSTGFHTIHALGNEGGRLCMSDHFHYGAGNGDTRKIAEKEALRAWADFVKLEYGSDWSNFSRAGSREVKCSNDAGSWSCNVSARPCRGGAVAATKASVRKYGKQRSSKRSFRRKR